MKPHFISRRAFLRSTGVLLPLPFLPSLHWSLHGKEAPAALAAPRRFLAVHFTYGIIQRAWWPKEGQSWETMPSLQPLAAHKENLTLLRGVSLVRGNTYGQHGEPYQFLNANRLSKVSMDQLLAAHPDFGQATRYSSLTAGGEAIPETLSFSPEGVPLPAQCDAPRLYQQLFGDDNTPVETVLARLRARKSMLDTLVQDLRDVERRLDANDRAKLAEYLNSVREVERKIAKTEQWIHTPKPRVTLKPPTATPTLDKPGELADIFLDLLVAAFETDQTRVASFFFKNTLLATPGGAASDYHSFTHHNGAEGPMAILAAADRERNQALASLLAKLKAKRDSDGRSLLDNTLLLYGSATEDANRHQGVSLPLILAGRPELLRHRGDMLNFKYGQAGMSDVLLTLLQAQGVEQPAFGESTRTLSGLV